MPVELIEVGLRTYEVTCDKCREWHVYKVKNKISLRDLLRLFDWRWRDVGILGIVEVTCPECLKKEHGDE